MKSRKNEGWRPGLRETAVRVGKRLAAPWWDWGTIVLYRAELRPAARREPPDGIAVRPLTGDDVRRVAPPFGREPGQLDERLARGDRCLVVEVAGEPAHMRWCTLWPTAVPELDLWICPGPGEVYVYDTATLPAWRGARLASLAREAMDVELSELGVRATIAYVRADNRSMQRSLTQAASARREIQRIRYVRLRGHAPVLFGPVEPPLHERPDLRSGGIWPTTPRAAAE